ncbi:hypothetical protein HanPSC8_Chr16g0710891 [Helianthus annuus]|nr:hypothetical protein HanPSC8_Chr16g0710891 [Helianthus annuus]
MYRMREGRETDLKSVCLVFLFHVYRERVLFIDQSVIYVYCVFTLHSGNIFYPFESRSFV